MVIGLNKTRKATSVDVARLAGVSQATVSRVFNSNVPISDDIRQRVYDAAGQLKYRPNAFARSLISDRTGIIGFIMSNLENPFYANVLSVCAKALQESGKQIMYFDSRADQSLDDTIHRVFQYRVDGLIITSANFSSDLSNECFEMGIPVILFNRYIQHAKVNVVCADNVGAGRMVANYLLEKKRRRFAYIGGRADSSTNRDRFRGFQDYLQQFGLPLCFAEDGEYAYESGRRAMHRIMAGDCIPDAVFCASDLLAFGAIDAARYDFKLRIPEDIAFVGCDDTEVAAYPPYSLTTVQQPVEDMIQSAINILASHEQVLEPAPDPVMQIFTSQLVCRSSA